MGCHRAGCLSVAADVFDLHVNHALGTPFAVGYVLGGVGAVVVVRLRGLFGAVVNPPLILLLAVAVVTTLPGAGSTPGPRNGGQWVGLAPVERGR